MIRPKISENNLADWMGQANYNDTFEEDSERKTDFGELWCFSSFRNVKNLTITELITS